MSETPDGRGAGFVGLVRHLGGFVASGLLAGATDASVLEIGVRFFGLSPSIARLAGIAVAMVVAWLAHRRLSFYVAAPPTFREFARFAWAASLTAAINYSVFVGLLYAFPGMVPFHAFLGSTAVATLFAYGAMRYAVFSKSGRNSG